MVRVWSNLLWSLSGFIGFDHTSTSIITNTQRKTPYSLNKKVERKNYIQLKTKEKRIQNMEKKINQVYKKYNKINIAIIWIWTTICSIQSSINIFLCKIMYIFSFRNFYPKKGICIIYCNKSIDKLKLNFFIIRTVLIFEKI